MTYQTTLRVWRGDARGGDFVEYHVDAEEGEVVLDVVHRLQATQAGDLAVRWNCKAGKCGSCSAEIDGRPRLMCMSRMSTFAPGQPITLAPMRTFPVIRDLVTDVSFNYDVARTIPELRLTPPQADGTRRMAQVDIARLQEFHKCIECFMCQNVCHVIRDHEENKRHYAGPRYFLRYAELDMHPLAGRDAAAAARAPGGIGMCNITKCCTEVCPEDIHITDNAIIPVKERVADRHYDPLTWLALRGTRRRGSEGPPGPDRPLDVVPPRRPQPPPPFSRHDVTFRSGQDSCAGWLYQPPGAGPFPCVVLGPGFGGVREVALPAYAERFVGAGLAALVFDYRHFGASGGAPRQLLDVRRQLQDWRAAVAFAGAHPRIDAQRVALWGTSLSGGHVLEVAAADHQVAAAVVQVPFLGDLGGAAPPSNAARVKLAVAMLRDAVHAALGRPPVYVPIVGPPGSVALLTAPDAEAGYAAIVPPDWRNEVTARSVPRLVGYRPGRFADRVQAPLLVTVQSDDAMAPVAVRLAGRAPHGKLREYPGGHFDIYGGAGFERAVADQTDFLHFYLVRKPGRHKET